MELKVDMPVTIRVKLEEGMQVTVGEGGSASDSGSGRECK